MSSQSTFNIIFIGLFGAVLFLVVTRTEKPLPINQAQLTALQDSLKQSSIERQVLLDSFAITVEKNARDRAKADSIHLLSIAAILEYKGMKAKNKNELQKFKQLPLDEQAEFWRNSVLQ